MKKLKPVDVATHSNNIVHDDNGRFYLKSEVDKYLKDLRANEVERAVHLLQTPPESKPVYQMYFGPGQWADVSEDSFNTIKHSAGKVRILYAQRHPASEEAIDEQD